ncbi:UNVERIFIED_CONTAM: hypothetical protein PYX00_001057 [Menopon gallinae]|uniref:DUF4485 domain-containing protein n=1 Tax=Menopon gallinae TaxID=328185 RepID=A0AAW2ICQ4_9NEOP
MENAIDTLNFECNYNIYMIKNVMNTNFKSQNDRTKILMWIKKLQICNNNMEEMYLRNDFMQFLWTCVKNSELRPPFDELPPFDQIQKLKHLLPSGDEAKTEVNTDWIEDLANADRGMPDLYRKSPDGGAFLSSQPIPKCGAFCYLAIVSKPCEEEE